MNKNTGRQKDVKYSLKKYINKHRIYLIFVTLVAGYQIFCLFFNANKDALPPLRMLLVMTAIIYSVVMIMEIVKLNKQLIKKEE